MGNGTVRFALSDDDNNNNGPAGIEGTTLINDGFWHHVVGVRDAAANQSRLYIDGVLEAQIGDTTTTFMTGGSTAPDAAREICVSSLRQSSHASGTDA